MSSDFNFYINRQGARGKQGEKGDQGFSPIITVASDTPTEYKLNIVTEDSEFNTTNLRANPLNIIAGAGKYVLFDENTNTMYNAAKPAELVDNTMFATTSAAGIIRLASVEDIEESSTDTAVTPAQLNDAIDSVEAEIPTDTVTHTELTEAIDEVEAQIPGVATSSTAGIVKPDGTTTVVSQDGTLTAIQSAPANMVTTDTIQTITANKSTTGILSFAPTVIGAGDKTINIGQSGILLSSGLASTSWNVTTDNGDLKFAVSGYGSQANGFTFTNNFTTIRLADTITIGSNTVLTNASVDGTTITYDSTTGKISAASSAPTNMVTTDTDQTITGNKTITGQLTVGTILQSNNLLDARNVLKVWAPRGSNEPMLNIMGDFSVLNTNTYAVDFRASGLNVTTPGNVMAITGEYDTTNDKIDVSLSIKASEFTREVNGTERPILDSSNVDGTTIVFDSNTNKISAVSSAPTVIDGGEEV